MPEFWIMAIVLAALVWNVRRNRRADARKLAM